MTMLDSTAIALLLPFEQGELIIRPIAAQSLAFDPAISTVVTTISPTYRVPVVATDPSAGWVLEGAEIPLTDATLDEVIVTPSKVAGLTVVSSELASDSNPAAAQVVGDGLARDMAQKIDAAFFGHLASPAPGGLASLTGTHTITTSANTWVGIDELIDGAAYVTGIGAHVTAWITSSSDAAGLAKIKALANGTVPLLQPDPTQPSRALIQGIPLYASPHVTPGTIWGVDASRITTVVREDVLVTSDSSAFFTSDRVAIRAVARIGFAFAHAASVVQVSLHS